MKVLEFIFTDLVHFAGVTLLLFLLFVAITEMIATWRRKYCPECQALKKEYEMFKKNTAFRESLSIAGRDERDKKIEELETKLQNESH